MVPVTCVWALILHSEYWPIVPSSKLIKPGGIGLARVAIDSCGVHIVNLVHFSIVKWALLALSSLIDR